MFSGIVAIIFPVGLSQGQRKIFSKGLSSKGATVLDYPLGDGGGASPASLVPNASQLLMKNASSKRKRVGEMKPKKAAKEGPSPTHVVCDGAAFAAGRVSKDLEGVFSRHPLKGQYSSVKVVASDWLSECLRLDSLQPLGTHLLETVIPEKAQKIAKGNHGAGAAAVAAETATSSWGCLAQPHASKKHASSSSIPASSGKNPWSASVSSSKSTPAKAASSSGGGGSSSGTSKKQLGLGAGGGGAKGPGELSTDPVWRDGDGGGGDGGGGSGSGRWEELMDGSVMRWVPPGARVSTHIVAFDMDGTIIKTKSGKRFGDSATDWELLHPTIPAALRAWYERGYKVAIISNQLGVGKGKVDKKTLKAKVEAVVAALPVPVEAYLACHDDYNRKPRPGCWELLSAGDKNGGLQAVKEACLYVGDAAGRPKQGTYKKDFSAGDLKLALNAEIPFQTPEQFFLRSSNRLHTDRSLAELGFDPTTLPGSPSMPVASGSLEDVSGSGGGLEVVVLVGPPASGKSTFCKDRLPEHFRVNQDELSSLAKCRQVATARLKDGVSVVIDATNPARNTRAGWLSLAREHGAHARCVFLTTPKEACFHLNAFRGSNPWSPESERRSVPDVVIHTWFKRLEPVESSEGFSEIARVPFSAREFEGENSSTERRFLFSYILAK